MTSPRSRTTLLTTRILPLPPPLRRAMDAGVFGGDFVALLFFSDSSPDMDAADQTLSAIEDGSNTKL